MSTARERLVDGANPNHIRRCDIEGCLTAFFAHPDDLLEVLVEAGVLEIVEVSGVISGAVDWMIGQADVYRRGTVSDV